MKERDLIEEVEMFRRGRPSAQRAYDLLRDGYINAADIPAEFPDSYEGRVAYERDYLSGQIVEGVQSFMEERGLNQQEVARRMGLTEGRVSQILSGEQNLTLRTLASLAAALEGHFHICFGEGITPPWKQHPEPRSTEEDALRAKAHAVGRHPR
ncbi:helix-turn-helix domain-containing protein [Blastococcus mobilis]|uniref:Helix-turn-helix n=1 Tax=Blastococcus mobilis TaxID=1938746 RepID=A0A239AI55_9ACTN|nr:helix-turn-helix transcriptional regulator [Blastococcus mobilis]SNR95061.1 Helix-turn-helix [Blastococcus mobilis]